ncbi:MAG TPA: hypothetical protein VN200_10670 [Rhodoglobus sp.]|nr:hypothetical protein [Rhodoglobus sp.]
MPVVTVGAPAHPRIPELLTAVADAIADALSLGAGDVLAVHVPAGAIAASGDGILDDGWWPVMTIHGGDRGASPSAAAREAADRAVRGWAEAAGRPLQGVWVTWSRPE